MSRRLLMACDHGGFRLKEWLKAALAGDDYDIADLGAHAEESVDYTGYAHDLATRLLAGDADVGILICGTGMGMSIAANRHHGIRAALCNYPYTARLAREHNDANVLCIGGRVLGPDLALEIVKTFLNTSFQGGRHIARVQNIELK